MRDSQISERPTLPTLARRRAAIQPLAHAFVTPDRVWTFADVQAESNRLAQGLRQLGIGPEDRIACYTKNSVECLIALIAAAKAGAVCAVFNWRLAAPELEYVVNQSEARLLITDTAFLPVLEKIQLPRLRQMLVTDADAGETALRPWRAAQADEDTWHEPKPGDTVLQLNSSGTTGLPKAIELSHVALLGQCDRLGVAFGYATAERFVMLNALPNFHVSGVVNMLSTMYEGGTTVCYPDFVPPMILEGMQKYRVTHTFMVPAMIQFLLAVPGVEQVDLSSLQAIAYGGSPISESLLTSAMKIFRCGFIQVYGMTEVGGGLCLLGPADHQIEGERAHLLRSAGLPVAGFEIKVVDPISGVVLPDGQTGEIWAKAPTIMTGYFRNPEATNAAFPEGRGEGLPWYRTGDAGCMREGYLYIQDRIKDMIISGGENIYPAEIELTLNAHPDIAEAAVIGVPDEKWGEAVKACVVLRPSRQASAEQIIEFCRERIASYKCPKSVDFVASLPRNPTGKLLKRVLREPYWAGRSSSIA